MVAGVDHGQSLLQRVEDDVMAQIAGDQHVGARVQRSPDHRVAGSPARRDARDRTVQLTGNAQVRRRQTDSQAIGEHAQGQRRGQCRDPPDAEVGLAFERRQGCDRLHVEHREHGVARARHRNVEIGMYGEHRDTAPRGIQRQRAGRRGRGHARQRPEKQRVVGDHEVGTTVTRLGQHGSGDVEGDERCRHPIVRVTDLQADAVPLLGVPGRIRRLERRDPFVEPVGPHGGRLTHGPTPNAGSGVGTTVTGTDDEQAVDVVDIGETRRDARERWEADRGRWRSRTSAAFEPAAAAQMLARIERCYAHAFEPLAAVYGAHHDVAALLDDFLERAVAAAARRPTDLRRLDEHREIIDDWFLDESMVGYVCYADRFAGDLRGVGERLDHLSDLGVTYLHLMPLLEPRPGPSDGGYAVADYRAVDPRVGDIDDLRELSTTLRARGISLCIDLVVNHTAREHEWARKAQAGDSAYRHYYLIFDDRTLPDAYEATLPEVFPDRAPGSFTWVDEVDGWVWTSFHDYQWDLNYANPAVLGEMLEIMLDLANTGVEIFRLDAVPFMWKRMGTNCQDQPEAHLLLQALRALTRVAAPGMLFKAEAIVGPDDLVQYLGAHNLRRDECDLAYHNQLMVMLWSSFATRDAGLATQALSSMRTPPPGTTWMTYVRGHDDIGWAVTDDNAAAVGTDAFRHREFLVDFFAGDFPGSYASGARFGFNPRTLDTRTSGTAASLAGIEQAVDDGDDALLDAAVSRLLALYAVTYGWGGIPLLYMGDEIALRNDVSYTAHTDRSGDNRWMHRPAMDWDLAARREQPGTLEARVFAGMRHLATARATTAPLHGDGDTAAVPSGNGHVLAWIRRHRRFGALLGLCNLADSAQTVSAELCAHAGLGEPRNALGLWPVGLDDGRLHLPALSVAWMTDG